MLRRKALQRADLVLAPSRDTADHLVAKQNVQRERVRVLPWALDPDFEITESTPKGDLPTDFPAGRVVLSVGRWLSNERYKGMDTVITALPHLVMQWPDLQYVAIGEGDDRQWLENIAEQRGVRKRVHFLSGLTYPQVAACYSACEIFALPSSGEGFGLVYLEAMARGKPVIAGAHGGAPEVVEDGVTGYLVQHGDVNQLATAIETLLLHPDTAGEMGKRGKLRVEHHFRFNVFAKSLKKIIRELCES
jgi:glycosyltransferase involved in cell wall biosynthesis